MRDSKIRRASIVTIIMHLIMVRGEKHGCPQITSTKPCACSVKSRGLDVTCELANAEEIRDSLSAIAMTNQPVWYLKFRNSQLPVFKDDLLGDLKVNHFIALNSNITRVQNNAFIGIVDQLESLDLAQNKLQRVPTEALENLINLASLNLNYNKIELLHAEAFRGLISLLRLSLFGNKIKSVDIMAFEGIGGNLTQVNFGDNSLTSVPSRPLMNLTVLQRLQVHDNSIVTIISDEFQGMGESLDVLEISNNKVEELPEKAFCNLRMLNSLDLENNRIRYIHPKAFEGIEKSLEWLKLGGNKLDAIPTPSLRNLARLRQLDLRQNLISKINEDDFQYYGRNLKFVYLQKNQLHTIEVNSFVDLDSVEWLYLQTNQLTSAPYETFRVVLDTLQVLDVHENPFVCDCRISWFRDWIKGAGSEVVNMPRETRCEAPPALRRQVIADVTHAELGCASSGTILYKSRDLRTLLLAGIMIVIFPMLNILHIGYVCSHILMFKVL